MHNKKRNVNNEITFSTLLKKCLLNLLLFCALIMIFSLLSGLIFFSTKDPTSKIGIGAYMTLYLSVAISSFVLSKQLGQKQILCGLLFGGLIIVLIFMISLILGSGKLGIGDLISKLMIIIISTGSSLLTRANNRKKRHKRHR